MPEIQVGSVGIGTGRPCFVIAEAGVNHNGEPELARRLVDVAANARADAVKFQTFDAARLASSSAPQAEYQKRNAEDRSQREMLERLQISPALHRELKERAESRGILFLSSPFDEQSADLLAEIGVVAFKIPSGELTNLPFLEHVARKGLPVLMSTGMSTLEEVERAVAAIRGAGAPPLALFHCVSAYPTSASDCNLKVIDTLRRAFEVPVGWSDHTDGIEIAVAAVALGASLIEKHLTLDRSLPGPDHQASLDPSTFTRLVGAIRDTEAALGDGVKAPRAAEVPIAAVARKSLHYARALERGATLELVDLIAMRPGTGVSPSKRGSVAGRRLKVAVRSGAMVRLEDLE